VLLLQGPMGPFFSRLRHDLEAAGATVSKVNFNGGDLFFYPRGGIAFRGGLGEWPAFFEKVVRERKINTVMLFGDCRLHHREAIRIARQEGIEVEVFEEGYLRPDYLTLERGGVNGYSSLPRDPAFYRALPASSPRAVARVGGIFWHGFLWAVLYFFGDLVLGWKFPGSYHHRSLSPREGFYWLRAFARKGWHSLRERRTRKRLEGALAKRSFLVPLQVYNDAQITTHSGFPSVEAFIETVMRSFAGHAPDGTVVVFKHHPLDRGYRDYRELIGRLAVELGISQRTFYVHDLHLPTMLKECRGVVVINSTVGMSALHHGSPLIACGRAIYDLDGLTFQGGLDAFWRGARRPDARLWHAMRQFLVGKTQIHGSFYRSLAGVPYYSGVDWSVRESHFFDESREVARPRVFVAS